MVRGYEKKTQRQEWSLVSMQEAVSAVINGSMGYKKAATQFQVPQTTLERYVKKKRTNADYVITKSMGNFTCVFNEEQEAELVAYLKKMEAQLFGLTVNELRELAFQLAERNNLKHPFGETGKAGIDWARGFLSRHPDLSLRKPEATSAARAMGFNKIAVQQFFTHLTNIVDTHKLTGDRIYNCDETGLTVNPKGLSRIIAKKGRRQVGTVTSGERGETVTAEICFSAAGTYIPPFLIFPRKRMRQEFQTGLPPAASAEVHETGWITKELFLSWFQKFISFSGASKQKPVLLLLDGHSTHTKNLALIDIARDNGVILLCLPPHCSHRLQPLDVSYMKPLSKYYEDEIRTWLRSNPGKVVTLFQVASLFGNAYMRASTMTTAVNGFRKTGIWPVNMNVFEDADFLPSATTDIQLPPANTNEATTSESQEILNSRTPDKLEVDLPSCSNFQSASPENITPIPKVAQKNKRVSKNRGKSAVLTSSPYKEELLNAEKDKIKKRPAKRRLVIPETDSKPGSSKVKAVRPHPPRCDLAKNQSSSVNEDIEEDDCLYCHDYSEEGWIRCPSCMKWAHNSCAGVDSDDDDAIHICVFCEN